MAALPQSQWLRRGRFHTRSWAHDCSPHSPVSPPPPRAAQQTALPRATASARAPTELLLRAPGASLGGRRVGPSSPPPRHHHPPAIPLTVRSRRRQLPPRQRAPPARPPPPPSSSPTGRRCPPRCLIDGDAKAAPHSPCCNSGAAAAADGFVSKARTLGRKGRPQAAKSESIPGRRHPPTPCTCRLKTPQ